MRKVVAAPRDNAGISIKWIGNGVNEKGINAKTGDAVIEVDPGYFRPTEVDVLRGDATKAREQLGWSPKYTLDELIKEMVEEDKRRLLEQNYQLREN